MDFIRIIMAACKNFSTNPVSKVIKPSIIQREYDTCIDLLNECQSNAQYIKNNAKTGASHNSAQLAQVQKYLLRSGLKLENLDELSVIHVAGTKGKGTTCALTECILREHGFKTGFYSSPHLIEVRERIRINGKPISKRDFSHYFTKIYTELNNQKENELDMPLYFRFLTIMAFAIFIDKQVDVAIIEVGIGGEYDCTNVLRKVPVVGITSLGIDHTTLLGSTVESIAWNKAGIMKSGSKAFTVPQSETAMKILRERSIERQSELEVIDPLHYKLSSNLKIPDSVLNLNASLAVALCDNWLKLRNNNNQQLSKHLTERALINCNWPGRFQIIQEKNLMFYLDGAHTLESVKLCSEWFKRITKESTRKKALLFNLTGGRDAEKLLIELKECDFDVALFVTNQAGSRDKSDNNDFIPIKEVLEKCEQHKELWLQMHKNSLENKVIHVFPTVVSAIDFLHNNDMFDILATGSLHLIGAVLTIIDPNMNDNESVPKSQSRNTMSYFISNLI